MKTKHIRNIPKIPPVIKDNNPLSDELYDRLMAKAKANPGYSAIRWIHIADAVSRGTITPLEAYDALRIGYCPENLKVRESDYFYRM